MIRTQLDSGQPLSVAVAVAEDKPKQVTVKEIEVLGDDLIDKKCELACTFAEVKTTSMKRNGKELVKVMVFDSKDDNTFCYAFKEPFAATFVKMKRKDPLSLLGTVKKIKASDGSYFIFFIDEIKGKDK
jgi:hypothetical protein